MEDLPIGLALARTKHGEKYWPRRLSSFLRCAFDASALKSAEGQMGHQGIQLRRA